MTRSKLWALAAPLAFAFAAVTTATLHGTAPALPVVELPSQPHVDVPQQPTQPVPQTRPVLEMVFVLDTTGSMGGLLEGAKLRIWGIVNDVMQSPSRPDVRVGLVAFRDLGDQYVTQVFPLTDDLDRAYANLTRFQAAGGGDGPENVRRALRVAVRDAGWSKQTSGVARILFLVGDAPPHDDYSGEPDTLATAREASQAGIVVNTIQCGADPTTTTSWRAISGTGQGQYFAISQDGGVAPAATPYDAALADRGAALGSTYRGYGADAEEATARHEATETSIAAGAPAAAAADRAVNKAINARAYADDFYQGIENGTLSVDAVPDDGLPTDLRELSPEARRQAVEQTLAERARLRGEIMDLSRKRDEHLKANREKKGAADGFDAAVSGAVKEQLERGVH